MHFYTISRIVGFYAILFALTLSAPVLVALLYGEPELMNFLIPQFASLLMGLSLWVLGLRRPAELGTRDGFLIVALFWVLLSLLGAWPMVLSSGMTLVDALFESASGLTTTGATVISGLDDMPRSFLFYRQQLQWLGGMGLIVLGVAVLPMLGIGGMQLYRAEVPGPLKEEKLTPRLTSTARALWLLYVGLTAACALGYWLAGMTPFDALAHSLATLSTGGFSTHDASLGYYQSVAVEAVAVLFMLLAAINFGIHFAALYRRDLMCYLRDAEARGFLLLVLGAVLLVGLVLRLEGGYTDYWHALRDASFEVVSLVTSTGFATVDFNHWPDFLPMLLIFISFIGGCGGSTAGGMKVMRVMLLVQQGLHEVRRLVHPHAVLRVRLGARAVDARMMQAVWGFFAAYMTVFGLLSLLMIHAGLDPNSAFAAVATSMNNLGPGLGEVAYTFQGVSDFGKLVAVLAMLLGRLEIFTLLVLLSPGFWRH